MIGTNTVDGPLLNYASPVFESSLRGLISDEMIQMDVENLQIDLQPLWDGDGGVDAVRTTKNNI